jgi:hypothetical protein
MSNYRQPRYEAPYSARNVSLIGTSRTDNFTQTSPQLLDEDDVPVPGYASFDERWASGSWFSDTINVCAIDTQLHMAQLGVDVPYSAGGGSAWLLQQMPYPEAPGQLIEYAIYARSLFGPTHQQQQNNDGDSFNRIFDAFNHGLYYGPTLPDESGGYLLGQQMGLEASSGDIYTECGMYSVENGKPDWWYLMEGQLATYYRVRVRILAGEDPAFGLVSLASDIGFTGLDWLTLDEFTSQNEVIAEIAPRYAGLFVSGFPSDSLEYGVFRPSMLCEFFRVVDQPYDEVATRIGGNIQLGSV